MIDRFTEKAKDAIGLAADAAESLGHHYVGTEHLLIGLIPGRNRCGSQGPG